MNFNDAKNEILQVLSKTDRQHLPKLLEWLKTSDDLDDFLVDNQSIILQSIAEDLRASLPLDAMAPSETMAIQKTCQKTHSTVHVDAFLYDDEMVDSLCEEGKMSRNYCLGCGSHRTAPLEFISHSFSIPELRFLFHSVLPDLTGKLVIDVGSRLGAVLYGGYLYSAAAQLVGVEISLEFVKLQTMAVEKYGFSDRIQVIHGDIRSQSALLQNADVLIMNNVFEYFMQPSDQMQAWQFIGQTFRKKGALLVTVPSIQESLALLQENVVLSKTDRQHLPKLLEWLKTSDDLDDFLVDNQSIILQSIAEDLRASLPLDAMAPSETMAIQKSLEMLPLSQWIEEVPLDYTVYIKNDTDADSLKQIHLYRVL